MLHMPVDREFAEDNDMVAFLSPYQLESLAFAVNTDKLGNDPTLAAFAEQPIGVELDTLSDFYLLRALNGQLAGSIRHYKTVAEAIAGLKAGEVSGVMGPRGELEGQLADKPANLAVRQMTTPGLQRGTWAMGLAVKARYQDLAGELDKIMAEMVKEGVIEAIFTRYGVTYTPPAAAPAS
ncbi:MAG: ABC transporter substrate-binding protein [Thiolinea sp.]